MIEVIDGILTDLAEPLGAVHVERQDEDTWIFAFAQDDFLEIAFDDGRKVVTVCKELVAPPPERRGPVYQLALQYNYLWAETGGGRLSLDGPDGSLVLSIDLALPLVDRMSVERLLQNIRATASQWTALVTSGGAGDGDGDPQPTEADGWLRA